MSPFRSGEVHVWSLRVESAVDPGLESSLSDDERRRAGRFRVAGARARFVAARAALRSLVGSYVGLPPAAVVFRYRVPWGKPWIEPVGGVDLRFNVAHSEELVVLAFCREGELGVDVERVRPLDTAPAMVKRYFATCERLSYERLSGEQRDRAFWHAWTRKEAYLKATGHGLAAPLDSFSVTIHPEEPPRLLAVDDRPDEAARWWMYSWEPLPGYLAALIVEGRRRRVRHHSRL